MHYMNLNEAAQKWKMSLEQIQELCEKGLFPGAIEVGRGWVIPVNAKPLLNYKDKNIEGSFDDIIFKSSKKCPFLIMTNLYHIPGSGDVLIESYKDQPEIALLLEIQFAHYRGELKKASDLVKYFLLHDARFEIRIGAGIMLSLCAMYQGDIFLWEKAKKYIASTFCRNESEKIQLDFWIAANDSAIYDGDGFPEWFKQGSFDYLPLDAYPSARFFYVKYLLLKSEKILKEQKKGNYYISMMKTISSVCEPLISQSKAEKVVLSEIYLRLICAIAYHNSGNDKMAVHHIDQAIELAIPDKIYAPLAEHRRPLDFLMDERLEKIDKQALRKVKQINKKLLEGWTPLHNVILKQSLTNELTKREREVSRLAVCGYTNIEIADQLHISVNTVKQALRHAMEKTNCKKRQELIEYL